MATYDVQPNPVAPGGEEQTMSYQQIMPILHGLKPGEVAAAGAAFKKLGTALDTVAANLRDTAMKLAADDSWRGAAAQAAMNHFQQLHDQAAQLAAQAHTTANSVNWIGTEVLPKYQAIPSPQVMGKSAADAAAGGVIGGVLPGGEILGAGAGYAAGALGLGPDGQATADKAAREYLSTLNAHLASAPFPQTVSSPEAGKGSHGDQHWLTSSGGGAGVGGGSGSGGSGAGSAMPGYTSPSGHFSSPKLPGATPSASLQGYAPPPSGVGSGSPFGPGSPGGINPAGGGSANPFSKVGMMPGDAGGGFGKGGLPGEGMPGSAVGEAGATGEAGAGTAGEAASAEAGAAGAAEGKGAAGMPMGGGAGSGQQDKERQRQAWMNEDGDIWGVPKDEIGPIIG